MRITNKETIKKISKQKSFKDILNNDLSNINLVNCNLTFCDIKNCNFSYSNLKYCDLSFSYIAGANFFKTNLIHTNLNETDLKYLRINDFYQIIMLKDQIQIGCEIHTPEEWENFTKEKINKMGTYSFEWWYGERFKEKILNIYKNYFGV
jgi:uncharacterized protein YjbI with pentapeptide repeats